MVRNKPWDQAGSGERQDWLEKPHRGTVTGVREKGETS